MEGRADPGNGFKCNTVTIYVDDSSGRPTQEDVKQLFDADNILFKAVKENHAPLVDELIRLGAPVNVKKNGSTPLHFAVWKGYDKVVQVLLDNEADPDAAGKGGATPLHYAAQYSHFRIVRTLLREGARFNSVTDNGKTPLDSGKNEDVIKLLKTIGNAFEDVKKGNTKVVNELYKTDMSILKAIMGAHNEDGKTLLAVAASSNYPKLDELKKIDKMNSDEALKTYETGKMYMAEGKYDMAIKCFSEIYQQRKTSLGPENLATLGMQMTLAEAKYKNGALPESLKLYQEILKIQKRVFNDMDNLDILHTRENVAIMLHKLGRCEEAYDVFQEVFAKQKEIWGVDHPETMGTESNLASVLHGLGRFEEALQLNTKQYEARRRLFGEDSNFTIMARNNMASVLQNMQKYDEALSIHREIYARRKRTLGVNHCDTLKTLSTIGVVLSHQKKYSEALKILQEVQSAQETVLGAGHLQTLFTQRFIGDIFLEQEKYSEALEIYQTTCRKLKAIFGPNSDYPIVSGTEQKIQQIKILLSAEKFFNFGNQRSGEQAKNKNRRKKR